MGIAEHCELWMAEDHSVEKYCIETLSGVTFHLCSQSRQLSSEAKECFSWCKLSLYWY